MQLRSDVRDTFFDNECLKIGERAIVCKSDLQNRVRHHEGATVKELVKAVLYRFIVQHRVLSVHLHYPLRPRTSAVCPRLRAPTTSPQPHARTTASSLACALSPAFSVFLSCCRARSTYNILRATEVPVRREKVSGGKAALDLGCQCRIHSFLRRGAGGDAIQ